MVSCSEEKTNLWPGKWILHHGSPFTRARLRVHEFLAKKTITEVDHPPYSPDLAPCDFWLFSKLKEIQEGADIC
jgi:histone-lysine N-methyltransferase SETMAR